MREIYNRYLKKYMSDAMLLARDRNKLSQSEMAEELELCLRSYADIEHGNSLCSTLTFVLYMIKFSPDTDKLVSDLKELFDKANQEI